MCLLRAKISYHCKAPENHGISAYMSDAVVAEMQNGWDLNHLKAGNEETLKGTEQQFGVKFAFPLFASVGECMA